jgi:tRNA-methyltransferase O
MKTWERRLHLNVKTAPPPGLSVCLSVCLSERCGSSGQQTGSCRTRNRRDFAGLSVAEVVAVEPSGALLLRGADVVDGTPVLDVKPYLPFADAVAGATAPPWVRGGAADAEADAEPLQVVLAGAAWEGLRWGEGAGLVDRALDERLQVGSGTFGSYLMANNGISISVMNHWPRGRPEPQTLS